MLFEQQGARISAVGPGTGTELWTLAVAADVLPYQSDAWSFDARHAVFFAARDPKSTRRQPQPCYEERGCIAELSVWDLEQQRELYRVPLVSQQTALDFRILGPDLVIIERRSARGFKGFRVRTLEASTGRERWASSAKPCGAGPIGTFIAGTPTSVYACGCDGVLRVLSRETGTEVQHFSVGTCSALMERGGRIAHAAFALNDPNHHMGVAVLTAEAFSGPEFSADVSGEISVRDDMRQDRWVRIGSQLLRADGRGRFKARVQARGVLSADIALRDAEDESGSYELLVLDGPSTHVIYLGLSDPYDE